MAALQHFVESDGSERFPAPLTLVEKENEQD